VHEENNNKNFDTVVAVRCDGASGYVEMTTRGVVSSLLAYGLGAAGILMEDVPDYFSNNCKV
jgi:hypothetical protein